MSNRDPARLAMMTIVREWISRVRGTFRPSRSDGDLQEELRAHLELAAEKGQRRGESLQTAMRAATIEAGSAAQAMEALRDRRGLPWLRDLARDLKYGARGLLRDPTFSAVAIASLACGIGANTAIFSLVNTVLLRSLPVYRPHELVFLQTAGTDGKGGAPPYPCFDRFRRETSAFAGMAAFATDHLKVDVDGSVEQVFGQVASGNLFDLLGVTPVLGRLMTPDDERLDPAVAVIGYGYWQRRFGGDARVLGRTLTFRNRSFTIVGVTPRPFWGLEPGRQVDVTLPITVEQSSMADAGDWWFNAVARLRTGATPGQATAQVDTIFQSFMKDRDLSGLQTRYFNHMELASASRGLDLLRSRFANPLYGLTLVAGLVLLIACTNLGNLLLVRGAARGREFAIRLATGAGSGRLFRQLMTETALLFACGAAAGVVLAIAGIQGLAGFFAVGRTPILLDVQFDWTLAATAAGVALTAALATGLWPARRALRTDLQVALKDSESRLAGSRRLGTTTRVLVMVQVAISFVLLLTATVFVKTILNLRAVDLGFSAARVLTLSLDPVLREDAEPGIRQAFWMEALRRVRALPGVRSATLSVFTPLSGRDSNRVIDVPGSRPLDDRDRLIHVNPVSDDYFETFGIQLVEGRTFTPRDLALTPQLAVINDAAAKAYFMDRRPIGQSIRFGASDVYQVIGVVRSTKHMSLREPAARFAFIPLSQARGGISRVTLAVDSDQPASSMTRLITQEVRSVHADTLVSDTIGVEDQIDATLVSERLMSTLAFGFAALALGLAGIGVYGVLSYSVAQRRTEFGVRLALGASPAHIAFGVLRQVLLEVAAGVAVGLPAALTAAWLARGLLFGVGAADPGNYVFSMALLAMVAALAASLPARRAWSIDPSETLRRG